MLQKSWKPAPPIESSRRPLRQPGSLTARLALHGKVTVDVLFSGWRRARSEDVAALGLPHAGTRVYERLVCVRRNRWPAVLARSVTTARGIAGPWRGLRRLGRQPLAALLWTNPKIRRGPFEYGRIPAADPLIRAAGGQRPLPARRSRFWLRGQPLVVLEAFVGLPWPAAPARMRKRRWRSL